MLTAAFAVLAVAVLFGAALALRHLHHVSPDAVPWPVAALHGLIGIAGLGCLLWALRGPPRGLDQGTASFGAIAAVFVGLAALAGLGILFMHRRRRRRAGTLIGIHAVLAVSGFVVLAAYLFA